MVGNGVTDPVFDGNALVPFAAGTRARGVRAREGGEGGSEGGREIGRSPKPEPHGRSSPDPEKSQSDGVIVRQARASLMKHSTRN